MVKTIPDVELRGKVRARPAVLDTDPSWTAAAQMTRRGELVVESAVVEILRAHGPLCHDDIHRIYRQAGGTRTPNRIRTVTAKLRNEGRVVEVDHGGLTVNRGESTRWELVKS